MGIPKETTEIPSNYKFARFHSHFCILAAYLREIVQISGLFGKFESEKVCKAFLHFRCLFEENCETFCLQNE